MLKDIIIVDNVFDDPHSIVEFAKQQAYYTKDEHPIDKYSGVRWKGHRTEHLEKINKDFYIKITNELIRKSIAKTYQGFGTNNLSWDFAASSFFHYLTDDIQGGVHVDQDCLYGGVVYLSENAPMDSGTDLYDQEGNLLMSIPNEFNKLILYNSKISHNATKGFGSSLEDGRLTLNVFFGILSFTRAA